MTVLFLFLIFLGLLCLGLPIAFVLGVTAFIMIAFFSPAPLQMVPEVMYNSLDTFPLMGGLPAISSTPPTAGSATGGAGWPWSRSSPA
jgi:hypothetical protein